MQEKIIIYRYIIKPSQFKYLGKTVTKTALEEGWNNAVRIVKRLWDG
jgi:hypothetical protein